MNSLEDAYLNIAKEEERLLQNLYSPMNHASSRVRRGGSIQLPELSVNRAPEYASLVDTESTTSTVMIEESHDQDFYDYLNAVKSPTLWT